MIRDITIGQYYAEKSVIHNLDPRTKLMGTLIYIIVLFLIKNPIYYLVCLAVILLLYHTARVPMSCLLKGVKGILLLLLFTFIFRLISTPGLPLFQWSFITITREGIIKSIQMTSRIALMITGASLLSYTSTPRALSDGLEKAFSFLDKVHIPVHEMALITMIAFRFIPIMTEELNALMDAQAARGAKFEDGSFIEKSKNVFSLLVPLFLSSLRRSSDIAMAMEARGYTGEQQTSRMYPLEYRTNDRVAYLIMCLFLSSFILLKIFVTI